MTGLRSLGGNGMADRAKAQVSGRAAGGSEEKGQGAGDGAGPDQEAVRRGRCDAPGAGLCPERGGHPHRVAVLGPGAGHRRAAPGADRGDLRARVLGQDHPGAALHRRGAEAGGQRRLYRRGARPGPGVRREPGGGCGEPAGLPAGHWRAGRWRSPRRWCAPTPST